MVDDKYYTLLKKKLYSKDKFTREDAFDAIVDEGITYEHITKVLDEMVETWFLKSTSTGSGTEYSFKD